MQDEPLFTKAGKDYGDEYKQHLFEQYKLYVQSAEKISDRRHNANTYFVSINTALITLLALSSQIDLLQNLPWIRLLLALFGILISVIFWFLINAYKQLNAGKFKVIHEIEQKLPLALYNYEWKLLGEGKDKKLYYPFSHVELLIPWVFGLIYLVLGIVFLLLTLN